MFRLTFINKKPVWHLINVLNSSEIFKYENIKRTYFNFSVTFFFKRSLYRNGDLNVIFSLLLAFNSRKAGWDKLNSINIR